MDKWLVLSQNQAHHGYLKLNFIQKRLYEFSNGFPGNYAFKRSRAVGVKIGGIKITIYTRLRWIQTEVNDIANTRPVRPASSYYIQ